MEISHYHIHRHVLRSTMPIHLIKYAILMMAALYLASNKRERQT